MTIRRQYDSVDDGDESDDDSGNDNDGGDGGSGAYLRRERVELRLCAVEERERLGARERRRAADGVLAFATDAARRRARVGESGRGRGRAAAAWRREVRRDVRRRAAPERLPEREGSAML